MKNNWMELSAFGTHSTLRFLEMSVFDTQTKAGIEGKLNTLEGAVLEGRTQKMNKIGQHRQSIWVGQMKECYLRRDVRSW